MAISRKAALQIMEKYPDRVETGYGEAHQMKNKDFEPNLEGGGYKVRTCF